MPKYIITESEEMGDTFYYVYGYGERIAQFLNLEEAKKCVHDHNESKIDDHGDKIVFILD